MSQDRTYVFSIDFAKPFIGKDSFLPLTEKFPVFDNSIYLQTSFWPFAKQRPPKIMSTGRTKPIKARILAYDLRTQTLLLSLERYTTVESNVKKYPRTWLLRSQLTPDDETT